MIVSPSVVAEEYRTAYRQLQLLEKQLLEVEAKLQRDYDLALKRYELARSAHLKQVLGEDDQFLSLKEDTE